MSDDMNILGGAALNRLLQTLPAKVEKNIMRTALRAGAKVLLEKGKPNIPSASGALRDTARVTTRLRKGKVSASFKVGNKKIWYAHLVEYGTKEHIIAPAGAGRGALSLLIGSQPIAAAVEHPGTKPHPFMRPAADAGMAEAVAAVSAKVRERLTKEGLEVPDPGGDDE